MFAFSNNGLNFRAVDKNYVAQTGEVLFDVMDASDVTAAQLTSAFSGYAAAISAQNTQQQIDTINNSYVPQFQALQKAYMATQMLGNTSAATTIQTAYQSLMTEYNTKMGAIS
jgi:hypothetical protein